MKFQFLCWCDAPILLQHVNIICAHETYRPYLFIPITSYLIYDVVFVPTVWQDENNNNNNSHTNNKTIFTELFSADLSEQFLFQAVVASSLGHEFLVRPLLHDFSFLHEDNVIGLLHRAQLMSHQQDR